MQVPSQLLLLLENLDMKIFSRPLAHLGVFEVADLKFLQENDLMATGMSLRQVRRIRESTGPPSPASAIQVGLPYSRLAIMVRMAYVQQCQASQALDLVLAVEGADKEACIIYAKQQVDNAFGSTHMAHNALTATCRALASCSPGELNKALRCARRIVERYLGCCQLLLHPADEQSIFKSILWGVGMGRQAVRGGLGEIGSSSAEHDLVARVYRWQI